MQGVLGSSRSIEQASHPCSVSAASTRSESVKYPLWLSLHETRLIRCTAPLKVMSARRSTDCRAEGSLCERHCLGTAEK